MKLRVFPLLLCGIFALPIAPNHAFADQYQCGLKAYQQGKHNRAFHCLQGGAEKGHIESQYLLSTMYRLGLGVEKDEYKAFEWCKKAAEEGFLEAQFHVGLMYLDGEGVTSDDDEAIRWLWAAAERGYPQASQVLQFIFSDDFGVGC